MSRKKIGLALGGGILRGMAHIGALEVLAENDIVPDILTGCSSGALVAAAYGCGTLGELKKFLSALTENHAGGCSIFVSPEKA